jgi:Acyltransferase family
MSAQNASNPRLFPLDFLKALSILAVVSYHSILIPQSYYKTFIFSLELLFAPLRFCVPVFFTISFLLLARGIERSVQPWQVLLRKRLIRLCIPTVFWFSLVVFLRLLRHDSIYDLTIRILSGNIFKGAYFLLALFQLTIIFVAFRKYIYNLNFFMYSIFFQISIYISIRILLTSDNMAQIVDILKTIDRSFFLYWIVYTSMGAFFWKNWNVLVELSTKLSLASKAGLLSFGSLLFFVEQYNLLNVSSGEIEPFEYTTISCVVSVFLMFVCSANIKENDLPRPIAGLILMLSKYSLGIFCIQGILSEVFVSIGMNFWNHSMSFGFIEILIIKVLGCVFLLLASLGLSLGLDRCRLSMFVK